MKLIVALVALALFPAINAQCHGVWSSMFDGWCDLNCNREPSFCPSSFCDCTQPTVVSTASLSEHVPGCCGGTVNVYFVELSNLYVMQVNQDTLQPMSSPTVCARFLGPSDIEIDENENIIVADPSAGAVYLVEAGCGTVSVITDWTFDQIVDQPTALALGGGGLYVAGSTRIFFLELTSEYEIVSHTQTDITILGTDSMDTAPDGRLFYLASGASIMTYNPADGTTETYTGVHQHGIPDMKGIKVTGCGLYISVTDSNQIWHCDDLDDGDSCEMLCIQDQSNLDASSCIEFNNPFGLTVDCYCNVYTASRGNGQLVVTSPPGNSSVLTTNLFHPIDVEIFAPQTCSPSESSTPSISRSSSPTPSRTASPTASPSSSASLTASPSPSSTPSPSSSVSASASQTASPTSSESASSSPSPTASSSPSITASSSPSISASSSPSITASSSPSITASSSASITASPTPTETSSSSSSPSPTPTASSSPSPTPTASPSPTPSELFEQFLVITDYNTVCSAGTCDGVDLTMLGQMPPSTRSIAVEHTLRYFLVLDIPEGQFYNPSLHSECDLGYDSQDTFPDGVCSRAVDPFDYINFDNNTWVTYIEQNDVGIGFPPYVTSLRPAAVGEYPNPLQDIPALAGVINCVGYNDVTFRVVIEEPRPIASDFRFGQIQMLRRDSDSPSNAQYVNPDGNNPDPLDAYKEFTCIESI